MELPILFIFYLTLNVSPFIIKVSPINLEFKKGDDCLSPASGRPPSNDPKIHETRIRMSDKDIEMLDFCCQKTGKKKAQIIRMGIKKVYDELVDE